MEDLADSEMRFQLLVDAVTDYAIYMLDPQGRVLTWNAGAERSKGYQADEVLGRNFSIFFLPEDAAAGLPQQELATAASLGRYAADGWRRRKDGSRFWAQVTLTAIRSSQGKLRGFAKVTRDLTAQKAAEEAIQSRNAQLEQNRIILENVSEYAIFSMDPQGRITSWTGGAERISGTPAAEIMGRPYSIFFSPEDVAAGVPETELSDAARLGQVEVDGWRYTPRGKRIWSSCVLSSVRDSEGILTGFVRVARVMTKQKEAEDSLRTMNRELERYRIIVDNVDEYSIYMLDPVGRITSWEAGAQKHSGVPAEVMLGRPYSSFFSAEEVRGGMPEHDLAEAARIGRYLSDSWRITPNGERVWSSGVLNALRDEAGNLTGYLRIARILTPQKQAEDALRALNADLERYRMIVENIDEYAIYTLDLEGRITSWEPGAQKMTGTSAEEMLGRHYSMFFSADEVAAGLPERDLAEAARAGRHVGDAWRLTPKGERVWSSSVINALRDSTGNLTGYLRIARILTPQKEAEDALRALNAQLDRYRVVVENISDHVIFTMDTEGRFDSWSPGAQNVLGYTTEEVLGNEYGLIFTAEARPTRSWRRELEEAAIKGHCTTEGWRVRQGGELYWCSGETTAIRDSSGTVTGFVRVARDMTRQKRLEESLSRQAAELEEQAADLEERVAERTQLLELTVEELRRKNEEVETMATATARDLEEKRVMLNEIHHRVKNNLQVVQSLLKMSVRSLPEGDARTVTMTTAQRVFAMAMVHERLYQTKDLAGISAANYLRDLFAGVADSNAALHGQVKVELECDEILLNLDHAIPFGLLVNELLSNCLKHAFPDGRKGTVLVSIHRMPGAVHVVFKDDGVGLREGFDAAKCTSMGLKLASSLARQLGGKLEFTSQQGCRVEANLTRL
jgi:PAS domain S-box-containing protein